jgi:hypothetical protein
VQWLLLAQVIAGCPVFPPDSIWNTRIDLLPAHRDSAAMVQTVGPDRTLFADFGAGLFQGGPIGIPFVVVPGTQPRVPISFQYADESDPGPYPIPPDAPIEGGPQSNGDRHVLVLDKDNCVLYEVFAARPQSDGSWRGGSGAVFDLRSNKLRPLGWTSADAAGLAIVPGLVRYDEILEGEIRHAIRLTVPQTRRAYVWPGTHFASSLTDTRFPPMGQRFRLRADFDLAGFSPATRVVGEALKRYGMILADNGSQWFLSGEPDDRWDNTVLRELRRIRGADLEAVDSSSLMVAPTDGGARQFHPGVVNSASFRPGPVVGGGLVSLAWAGVGGPGTTVTFDGIEAELLHSGSDLVNVRAPDLAGPTTQCEVRRGGERVFRELLPVAESAPGVFPVDGPWRRGATASFAATGTGADVAVRLGGRQLEVVAVAREGGVTTVEVRVPADFPVGEAPLLLVSARVPAPVVAVVVE